MRKLLLLASLVAVISTSSFAKTEYSVQDNLVIIDLDGYGINSEKLVIDVWSASILRVIASETDEYQLNESLFFQKPTEIPKFKVMRNGNSIDIETKQVRLSISEDGLIRFFNMNGQKMLFESNREFGPTYEEKVKRIVTHKDTTFVSRTRVGVQYKEVLKDSILEKVTDSIYMESNFNDDMIQQRFYFGMKEHIYGFGGQADHFDIRNSKTEVKQDIYNIFMPYFYSDRGYAVFWDDFSELNIEDTRSGVVLNSDKGKQIEYFYVNGASLKDVLNNLSTVLPDATMLPRAYYSIAPNNIDQLSEASYRNVDINFEEKVKIETLNPTIGAQFISDQTKNVSYYMAGADAARNEMKQDPNSRYVAGIKAAMPDVASFGGVVQIPIIDRGDVEKGLRVGLSLSTFGVPYWTYDFSRAEMDKPWMRNAVLASLFAPVCTTPLPIDEDPYIADALKYRSLLSSYIYAAAYDVVKEGHLLAAPVFYNFPNTYGHEYDHQFMLGKDVLVAPPYSDEGETKVSFPKGAWYHLKTNKKVDGRQISFSNTEPYVGLFAKAGSIIPLDVETPDSLVEAGIKKIQLTIYGDQDAKTKLYTDDGKTLAWKDGKYSIIDISYISKSKTVVIGSRSGDFKDNQKLMFDIEFIADEDLFESGELLRNIQVVYQGKGQKVKLKTK